TWTGRTRLPFGRLGSRAPPEIPTFSLPVLGVPVERPLQNGAVVRGYVPDDRGGDSLDDLCVAHHSDGVDLRLAILDTGVDQRPSGLEREVWIVDDRDAIRRIQRRGEVGVRRRSGRTTRCDADRPCQKQCEDEDEQVSGHWPPPFPWFANDDLPCCHMPGARRL